MKSVEYFQDGQELDKHLSSQQPQLRVICWSFISTPSWLLSRINWLDRDNTKEFVYAT